MTQLSPALALATQTNPADLITADSVNRQTRNSGGLVDIVTAFAGKDEITDSSSATITCIANSTIRVNAWRATAQTIQLPAWSANHPPILITTNNYAVKTIQRAGTDTINDPWNYSTAPVNTTYTLRLPGQTVWVIPNKLVNFWDIKIVNFPKDLLSVRVSGGTQAIATSSTILTATTVISNPASLWNTGTSAYTALYTGYYNYFYYIDLTGGLNWEFRPFINGVVAPILGFEVRTVEFFTFSSGVYLTAGDVLDFRFIVNAGANIFSKVLYITMV